MKTYLDVIEETVAFYTEDVNRRSFDENNDMCMYNGPDGKQCAFARCANEIDNYYEGQTASSVISAKGFGILKPEYRHLTNKLFWYDLQNFHDDKANFNDTGLTDDGELVVENLINKYK